MLQQRFREIFTRMVEAKDLSQVPAFYHPEFLLYTNGQTRDYAEFYAGHARVYPTELKYRIEYDDDVWVESGDRLAGRIWITTARPDEAATRIEVMFVAIYRDGLIHRLWELTWPDWSHLVVTPVSSSGVWSRRWGR